MIVQQEEHDRFKLDSVSLNIMNTDFFIAVEPNGTDWKNQVLPFLQYINEQFSRFQTNNELWNFNNTKRMSTTQVSPILYDILTKAESYREKSGGRFSPYLLTQMEAHGYNRSFPFKMASNQMAELHYETDAKPLIFLPNNQITKNTDLKVDLGGIAKGYAVEAISKWLQQNTESRYGIVDGGGDMSMWSNCEKTWKIGVMDPFDEEKEIGSFSIKNGGVATSNILYRSWMQGETKKHHILDGRTGKPVETSLVQATVITEHCLDAEVSAKLCFMANPLSIDELLSGICKNYSYVLVKSDKTIVKGGTHK